MSVRPLRIGFLVPPGNPTVEPEMASIVPEGVTLHFTRMHASGETGSPTGQDERNRQQIESLDDATALLAMVHPAVIVLAHTATSYTLGRAGEAALVQRIEAAHRLRFVTAFAGVLAALAHLGVRRVALGTPYALETTLQGGAHLEAHGIEVVNFGVLPGVVNIYDETLERARELGHQVDHPDAEAIFLSGVGMPTLPAVATLERELNKPVVSAAAAMMWHALRTAGHRAPIPGHGRLLGGA